MTDIKIEPCPICGEPGFTPAPGLAHCSCEGCQMFRDPYGIDEWNLISLKMQFAEAYAWLIEVYNAAHCPWPHGAKMPRNAIDELVFQEDCARDQTQAARKRMYEVIR